MDWAKAKSILILVLAALNIFLLSYIIRYRLDQNISKETIADTQQVLFDRGIKLECEIPKYNDDTSRLIYENGNHDRQKIATRLLGDLEGTLGKAPGSIPDGIPDKIISGSRQLVFENGSSFEFHDKDPTNGLVISGKDTVEKQLRKMITELGLKASNYRFEGFTENSDSSRTYVFTEMFKKLWVFDNRIEFIISQDGILHIGCSYRKIKGFSSGTKTKIMAAYKILLKNFNQGDKAVITNIDIGFKGYAPQQDMVGYSESPAWRIMFGDGSVRYFKASDGEEVK